MTDALVTAEKLLQANAVRLSPQHPFTWASGWKSPIYCDNRVILAQPFIRDFIKSEMCHVVFELYKEAELIAGVATAGIPWGSMIADQLKLPFIYVRPKPKEHGMGNQIEGLYEAGQKTMVIEDLISTGRSSLQVVDILRQKGLEITGLVSIFNYDFPVALNAFRNAGVRYHSLTNYESLLTLAVQKGMIHADEEEVLLKWRTKPEKWAGLL